MSLSLTYYLLGVIGSGGFLASFFVGGKRIYQTQLVSQLKDLVQAQEQKIDLLTEQNEKQQALIDRLDARCEQLEKIIDDNSGLVVTGDLSFPHGARRRRRSADPQRSKDG